MIFIVITAIALICYVILPAIMAIYIQQNWKRFRMNLVAMSKFPQLTYRHTTLSSEQLRENAQVDEDSSGEKSKAKNHLGWFHFFGTLNAKQPDKIVWARGKNISATICVKKKSAYFFSNSKAEESEIPSVQDVHHQRYQLKSVSWNFIYTLAEGTNLFVAAPLSIHHGILQFLASHKRKMLLIFYNGKIDNIIDKLFIYGRNKNEYWNNVSLFIIILGMFLMLGYTFFALSIFQINITHIIAIIGIVLPILPFLPPGVCGYLGYRRLWYRGKAGSVQYELQQLHASRGDAETASSLIGTPSIRHIGYYIAAGIIFVSSVAINAWLLFTLLMMLV